MSWEPLVHESHGIFNFSDDLFESNKKERIINTDTCYTPRPIFEGWFRESTESESNMTNRKYYYNYLYWKGEFQQIIQELPLDLDKFEDPSCILRREFLDCLIRSYLRVQNGIEALYYVDVLVGLQIVDLGSRVLAAAVYLEAGRVDDALRQLALYIKERPSVFQVWLQIGDACRLLGDFEVATAAYKRAQCIASKHQVLLASEKCQVSMEAGDNSAEIPADLFEMMFPNCTREAIGNAGYHAEDAVCNSSATDL